MLKITYQKTVEEYYSEYSEISYKLYAKIVEEQLYFFTLSLFKGN